MTTEINRDFSYDVGVRKATPLLIGLTAPSTGGKTYSALRLATGIQRVVGGEIAVIDTESNRALHYADKFRFNHVPFGEPFSPLDYMAAIKHCLTKGAKTIIVDSMSHEHEGPGGVLEEHDEEIQRLMKLWNTNSENKVTLAAWSNPKKKRRRLINTILQINANFIFCFRAKEKLKIIPGKDPEQLGFMPIAGEEFIYEMTVSALLPPRANGVPNWNPSEKGERMMVKLPEQFRALFAGEPAPLDERAGEQMALWAAGVPGPTAEEVAGIVKAYEKLAMGDSEALTAQNDKVRKLWPMLSEDSRKAVKKARDKAKERVTA